MTKDSNMKITTGNNDDKDNENNNSNKKKLDNTILEECIEKKSWLAAIPQL